MNKIIPRVGSGFDVHAFEEGRALILGGVDIPYQWGLKGHSDADVLLHAITDALLGAAALGDIGTHFPDNDPEYKDVDSRKLLRETVQILTQNGYAIGNTDATVVAQMPKLKPYISLMRETIAEDLGINKEMVSVKATTTEKLGFTGRGEGIAAMATVLIYKEVKQ